MSLYVNVSACKFLGVGGGLENEAYVDFLFCEYVLVWNSFFFFFKMRS